MKQILFIYIFLIFLTYSLNAQGLFESTLSNSAENNDKSYELNGYVRGAYFISNSQDAKKALNTQAAYGESALKLKVDKKAYGESFAELRFYNGYLWGDDYKGMDLREAWIKYYIGNFDFSIGKQIIVWGRADGYNPTNMLAPMNMIARSANEDDKRVGNWMTTVAYNYNIINIEAVWIPVYKSHIIPFGLIGDNSGFKFSEPEYPNFDISNSSFAVRANVLASKIDGSISYFSGYSLKPGVCFRKNESGPSLFPKAYKISLYGADFQTTIGKYGLRGEFAYTVSEMDKNMPYVPNDDIQFVVGIDRTWNNFSLLMQYSSKYVFDFVDLPDEMPADSNLRLFLELEAKNRLFNQQQYQVSHNVISRVAYKFFHETMDVSMLGMFNFTTEEIMIRPKIAYFITDAMELSGGMEFYYGSENTFYGLMGKILNAGFVELKVSF